MLLPEFIDPKNLCNYVLSIRIKPDGFAFVIHNPHDVGACFFHEVGFSNDTSLLNNIRRIILDDDNYKFLTEAFKQTHIVVVSADYELMPDSVKEKQQIKTFYRFTHDDDNVQALVSEKAVDGCNLVFGMDNELHSLLKRSIYNPKFYHHNGLQLRYFREKSEAIRSNAMFVYFHENFVDVNCFDADSKLLFAYTYYNELHQNVVYHILNIWEKLGFNQLEHYLIVSGYYPDDRMETTLKEYIKLVKSDGLFEFLVDFGEKAQNMPLDLLTLPA
jgi:hypothetical protein